MLRKSHTSPPRDGAEGGDQGEAESRVWILGVPPPGSSRAPPRASVFLPPKQEELPGSLVPSSPPAVDPQVTMPGSGGGGRGVLGKGLCEPRDFES